MSNDDEILADLREIIGNCTFTDGTPITEAALVALAERMHENDDNRMVKIATHEYLRAITKIIMECPEGIDPFVAIDEMLDEMRAEADLNTPDGMVDLRVVGKLTRAMKMLKAKLKALREE